MIKRIHILLTLLTAAISVMAQMPTVTGNSSYVSTQREKFEAMATEGDTVYVCGSTGAKKIDFSATPSPTLIGSVTIAELSDSLPSTRCRGLAMKGNVLYVTERQTTSGQSNLYTPSLRLMFEGNETYDSTYNSTPLSSNTAFNRAFRSLSVPQLGSRNITAAYLQKARLVSGQYVNGINLIADDKSQAQVRNTYSTEQAAQAALTSMLYNAYGSNFEVNWDSIADGYTRLSNFQVLKTGEFHRYESEGEVCFRGTKDACPIRGEYALEMSANGTGDRGLLIRNLYADHAEASVSFWIRANRMAGHAEVPLMMHGDSACVTMELDAQGTDSITVSLRCGDSLRTETTPILLQDWYQVKVNLHRDTMDAYIRTKETARWQQTGTISGCDSIHFDRLCTGLTAVSGATEVLMDEYYFHETEIDDVSLINGQVSIVDKETMEVMNVLHLDTKCIDAKVQGNTLFVTCFYGFNVYDISEPAAPVLKFTYRSNSYVESQNCEFFQKDGNTYVWVSNYIRGYTIVNVTDIDSVYIAAKVGMEELFPTLEGVGKNIYTFDAAIDYPYAYLTISAATALRGTAYDKRGVMQINLQDFNQPQPHYTAIPEDSVSYLCDNDPGPIHIAVSDRCVLANNYDKGIAVFTMTPSDTLRYEGNIDIGMKVNDLLSTAGDRILVDGYDNTTNKSVIRWIGPATHIPTGTKETSTHTNTQAPIKAIYNVQGMRMTHLQSGINIVVRTDGTVERILYY